MNLHEVILKEDISSKFEKPVIFEQYGMNDIQTLAEIEPNILHEIGAQAWMLYVECGVKVNSQKLAEDFQTSNPLIYKKVEKIMKRKVVQDISFSIAKVQDGKLERDICCKLLLCRMWPNDLYLADVELSNPYEPVAEDEKKYNFHEYRSLGLFADQLKNMISYCKEHKIEQISLTTASNDQIPYFARHGFEILMNNFTKQALKYGASVPMFLKCI